MAPKPVSAAKFAAMSQPERYNYLMAGGLHPTEAAALTQEGRQRAANTPEARAARARQGLPEITVRMEDVNSALADAGFDQNRLVALAQVVDLSALVANAKTTRGLVQDILTADAYIQGAGTQAVQNRVAEILTDYREGMSETNPAEMLVELESLGVSRQDPAISDLVGEVTETWQDEYRGAIIQRQNQDALEGQIAQMQAEEQARTEAREEALVAQVEREDKVNAVLEKYSEHGQNPIVSEIVLRTFENGVPDPAALESTIQEALVISRSFEMATEAFQRDKAIHDQLVAGGAYGRDPQTGEVLAPEPEIRNHLDFMEQARKEVAPEEQASVSEQFDQAHAAAEARREAAEEVQVTAAQARAAADSTSEGKSSAALEWEARQANHVRPDDDIVTPARDY